MYQSHPHCYATSVAVYTERGVVALRLRCAEQGYELDRRVLGERMIQEHSNGGTPSKARLLVVDDHAFIRVAINAILSRDSSLEVVAEAQDGQQATQLCR